MQQQHMTNALHEDSIVLLFLNSVDPLSEVFITSYISF
ncbi:hypothetical protein SAMN05216464_101751 [Mucilaginibacter pineti]|uniref:Uncharacterized protein n=1 Tax=Mucilaginibacter pineti TaxID=1391627 RepID=A0A1G6UST4_9SPHI|nr:hypothetical protein SAMN05216464_101751 [Mucilaginibacter pineti]